MTLVTVGYCSHLTGEFFTMEEEQLSDGRWRVTIPAFDVCEIRDTYFEARAAARQSAVRVESEQRRDNK
jgi:hypothetical protein